VLGTLVDWAAREPRHLDLMLDQLEQLTGELIRWSVSTEAYTPDSFPWANSDGRPALVQPAKAATKRLGSTRAAREFWIERSERMALARQQALAPLNRKLLIQDLLLPWLQAV
jgi:hypothetical protein